MCRLKYFKFLVDAIADKGIWTSFTYYFNEIFNKIKVSNKINAHYKVVSSYHGICLEIFDLYYY